MEIRRITGEEVEQMESAGVVGADERVELLDGTLYRRPAITPWRAAVMMAAQEALCPLCGKDRGFDLRIQMPFAPDKFSRPTPDVSVVPGHW